MNRLGRALGSGRFYQEQRGRGPVRWILDWRAADGSRHRQALSTDRRVAERARADIIRRRDLELAGLGSEEGQESVLSELLALYLADLRASASPTHVTSVTAAINRILKSIDAKRVRDVRPHMLMQHRVARLDAGTAVRTVNMQVGMFKTFLSWALQAGLIAANPIANLAPLPQRDSSRVYRRRALSEDEIEHFLAAARADDQARSERALAEKTIKGGTKARSWAERRRTDRVPQAPMWRAFVEVGGRYGEMTRLTWADIDFEKRFLTFRAQTTKSGRERTIPLRDGLCEELKSLRTAHIAVLGRPIRPDERVFLSPQGEAWPTASNNVMRMFERILEAAGIDRIDAARGRLDVHALRHTLATRLARSGVGLVQAQRILGHSDPKLTAMVYSHVEAEDLRGAIEQLPGPNSPHRTRLGETA